MLYQKLISGERPYFLELSGVRVFERHRHSEIEFNYCAEGSYSLKIDRTEYKLKKGDLAVIGSEVPHEVPRNGVEGSAMLVAEIGPVFLSAYFEPLARATSGGSVISVDRQTRPELHAILTELAGLCLGGEFSELYIKSDLYRLCACVLSECRKTGAGAADRPHSAINVEKALDLIYKNYNEKLPVREVAQLCGYSVSNFCKTFKNVTGDTFHGMLNRRRVEITCHMLRETNAPLEDVAAEVGFADAKTLCRVFKAATGSTAGEYRRDRAQKR